MRISNFFHTLVTQMIKCVLSHYITCYNLYHGFSIICLYLGIEEVTLASHALQILVVDDAGLHYPLAHFATQKLTSGGLSVIMDELYSRLAMYQIHVDRVFIDGAATNRGLINGLFGGIISKQLVINLLCKNSILYQEPRKICFCFKLLHFFSEFWFKNPIL